MIHVHLTWNLDRLISRSPENFGRKGKEGTKEWRGSDEGVTRNALLRSILKSTKNQPESFKISCGILKYHRSEITHLDFQYSQRLPTCEILKYWNTKILRRFSKLGHLPVTPWSSHRLRPRSLGSARPFAAPRCGRLGGSGAAAPGRPSHGLRRTSKEYQRMNQNVHNSIDIKWY